ncbi:MAG: enoyl-CoA hydratase [Burkholderiaceae bacterium]
MKSSPVVLCEINESVALVTLNRADNLNALSSAMIAGLVQVFAELRDTERVAAVVLTGAGRAFSAGLDLKELSQSSGLNAGDPIAAIHGVGKPVIGAVNGYAITGGLELALACDFLICSDRASFADTHALVGVVPGWGLTHKLPATIGLNRARQMSFTGRFIDSSQALAFGLVNEVLPPEQLLTRGLAIAADMVDCHQPTLGAIRELMEQGWGRSPADAMAGEKHRARQANAQLSTDAMGDRLAALQRRSRT